MVLYMTQTAGQSSAEQHVEAVGDAVHTSHAAGSVTSLGLEDEVAETTAAENAVDARNTV
eukprot:6482037-Amphidinium_carterae.3